MELQAATIAMLGEAIQKGDKSVVQVANLLHTMSVYILLCIVTQILIVSYFIAHLAC